MRSLRALRDNDQGTTLVEFALVVPVLILLVVGCLDFARAANAYVIVSNASREGARYASAKQMASAADVLPYVLKRIAPLDPSALQVSNVTYAKTSDDRWAQGVPAPGTVTVVVRYDWQAATWLAGAFFGTASGSRTFEVSSTMETIQSWQP